MTTDLEAFDRFAEQIDMPVQVLTVGHFLPARQLEAKGGEFVNFLFGDDGDLQSVHVVAKPT